MKERVMGSNDERRSILLVRIEHATRQVVIAECNHAELKKAFDGSAEVLRQLKDACAQAMTALFEDIEEGDDGDSRVTGEPWANRPQESAPRKRAR